MTGPELEWLEPRRPKQPGREQRQLRKKRPSERHGRDVQHPPKPGRCTHWSGCTSPRLDGWAYCSVHHRQVVEHGAEIRRKRPG